MGGLLVTEGMSKQFGPLVAVNNVSMTIKEGIVSGVIGPNGSGKTTLFNLLSGLFPPTEGKIFFQGQDVTGLKPPQRVNLGIGRSFQLVSIFPHLKVYENLVLPALRFREKLQRGIPFYVNRVADKEEILEDCRGFLEMVGLEKKMNMRAGELSYGDQRMLEIVLSLSLKPKILLLDEPFAGLGDVEISFVLELLNKVKKDFTIVIIEHKISKIENFVEHLFVLSQGSIICQGKPADVFCDAEVRRCYWGEVD